MRAMPTEIDHGQISSMLAEGAVLFDVLPQSEYDEQHIPGARSFPLRRITREAVADLDRARPVITYCGDYE
jgi:rhodanese-related sulfurtransferase